MAIYSLWATAGQQPLFVHSLSSTQVFELAPHWTPAKPRQVGLSSGSFRVTIITVSAETIIFGVSAL